MAHFAGETFGGGNIAQSDPTLAEGKILVGVGQLDERLRQFFWDQINAALTKVFGLSGRQLSLARERLAVLRAHAENSDEGDFAAAVYHNDPFQIAKDLAGVTVVTQKQKERYLNLLKAQSTKFVATKQKGHFFYNSDELANISKDDLARTIPDDILPPSL